MHLIEVFIRNPVKVSVAVLLVALFGIIALFRMPLQLTPEVETPTITVETVWRGATPYEIEREIIQEQEEQLKSVEGITKLTSECKDSMGTITMEFLVGTNMSEAAVKVNSKLEQVQDYPENVDKPVIRTASSEDRAIAWFILSARPKSDDEIYQFQQNHPELKDELQKILDAHNEGLAVLRLRRLAEKYPEVKSLLPADIDVPKLLLFAEDFIESELERVPGVSNSNVLGGEELELQVVVDPRKLAARGLTIADVRQRLREQGQDTSGGDFWEGKRRYTVRTLGQFRNLDQVRNVILADHDGQYVNLRDVVQEDGVRLGYKKPDGFVRRFGVANIAINATRETNANVIDVMGGLRAKNQILNDGILKDRGLVLTQVYDETDYINSAIRLVNQNIILGGSLTVIVLMLFLHLNIRTLLFAPLIAGTALLAVFISPWFFVVTLLLILVAGFWFARGALVVALAIPTSIVGTFLLLGAMGRSLNVVSLAGLAFAVGMLVDNAVVVLENIYRHWQSGDRAFAASERGTKEVWGAVVASTLTTLAVFLPVVFMQEEAGQLFRDIALAISCAVGLSLLVSVTVIPTASARILGSRVQIAFPLDAQLGAPQRFALTMATTTNIASKFVEMVVSVNAWLQLGWGRRIVVVLGIIGLSIGGTYLLRPKVEYLPTGNRNLVICMILPPPGYNVDRLMQVGQDVEDELRKYWDIDPTDPKIHDLDYPAIDDFFYVVRQGQVFLGLRASDASDARKLIDLVSAKIRGKFPGTNVVAFQSSLFSRGLAGGRTIDVEITGPELTQLVKVGGQVMQDVFNPEIFPAGSQARPLPSLDLSSPELHVIPRPEQAKELGVTTADLGYIVDALVDGAYASDYFMGSDKIDVVILGNDSFTGHTQELGQQYVATPLYPEPVRLDMLAKTLIRSGPEQINHRERSRAITIQVTPPESLALEDALAIINTKILPAIVERGELDGGYQINLSGTADKLKKTWDDLFWNLVVALLITYLLMAALFESWIYPLVIIVSVPLGAVGGIIGLRMLSMYLFIMDEPPQVLDVLTMLGFIILIGTVVNNAILIVHQSLNLMRSDNLEPRVAILESVRSRIRPIFMTTATTCFGLAPLVFFPGAGAELYRGLGSVVLGGLVVSTFVILIVVPTLFSLMLEPPKCN